MTDTMKGVGENLFGTSTSSRAPKKRKNVASVKPAPKPKKRSTRSTSSVRDPTEGVSANDAEAPNEGSEANAVTPARPA